ncbi:hypothetical protein LJB92_01750, partial [Bacteroidales bacterium OttesenSCG-928-M06]|nr:hypothetical protein [Bacteroidales bacterium OttesenSCG-928-M06]
MKYRILFLLTLLFSFLSSSGKSSPVEIKYTVMDLYALRYYPFSIKADSIVEKLINQTNLEEENLFLYKKTSIDFIGNKEIIERQVNYSIQSNDFLYKYLLNPYIPWIQFATPLKEDNRELVMTLGLHEETREKDNVVLQDKGIYHFAGKRNVAFLMDRLFNDI